MSVCIAAWLSMVCNGTCLVFLCFCFCFCAETKLFSNKNATFVPTGSQRNAARPSCIC